MSRDDASEPSTPPPGEPVKPLPGALAFVGMGTTIAACVGVGVVAGIAADDQFGTSPLLLIVGLVLGALAAGFAVAAQVRRFL